ncbi:PadR family transcriptional regulator [Actinoplanes sp. N902-109]|uniref:PadR family transcriptional regulator n=1 Tax=Actinoplanes sp. (strain N902-109) TaxID=649831 RepID=UPI00059EE6B1|nr:PadR family transcriptional regulator [Actinoplanes sp. N902-109]
MKRRKVASMLALAVLSALVERPMHPYEMAVVLRERGKDEDMEIKWGSLYTVVRNLARHELIEQVGTQRDGRRPERTVYRLTAAGRAELLDWIRELIAWPTAEHPRFRAGLSVLAVLHPDEATALLRDRLTRLREGIAAAGAALARHRREVPRLFLIEAEYDMAIRVAEADWIEALLAGLETGTFPGLADWRAFQERQPPGGTA